MKKSLISAFSLIELTLALGVAACCLMAVFDLMPVGVQTNRNATSQTLATDLAGSTSPCGVFWSPPIQTRYQARVTFSLTGNLTYADLKVGWPPTFVQTSPAPVPSGSVEMFVAFDRR